MSKLLVEIKRELFNPETISKFPRNHYTEDLWPLVYILSDGKKKQAYIGETTDVISRMSQHLKSDKKKELTSVHLITSDKFNKSATLDLESNLIRYISGDGHFKLLNANVGVAYHTYFEKTQYWELFKTIWNELKREGLTFKTIEQIDNSDLFKYSPYKALTRDQRNSVAAIMESLLDQKTRTTLVQGGAGTGKTIVALYLFKLLHTPSSDINVQEFDAESKEFFELLEKLKKKYPEAKMALVVPMASFRTTLKKVFKSVRGLNPKMVIGPAEVATAHYDILVVDEAHRLRQRVNLGAYFGAFDSAAKKMGFDKMSTNELEWVRKKSDKQILFYDQFQSIKPSDVDQTSFETLKFQSSTKILKLISQFRVKGGIDYVHFITSLLDCNLKPGAQFSHNDYKLELVEDIAEFKKILQSKNEQFGLSRMIAGYSWKWVSKKSNAFDINIDGTKLRWNRVANDWINHPSSPDEVGCIHTTQGYDLNYAGIIFGNEIGYDNKTQSIIIRPDQYFDTNGKHSIRNPQRLKDYIINIYKTMMLRGIRGTFVYVCDPDLRAYFKEHLQIDKKQVALKIIHSKDVKPFINAVPQFNFKVAAGLFTSNQNVSDYIWVELPKHYKPSPEYFVCQVKGESMNKVIPNGSWCLFKKYTGGTRNGKIVLVKHQDIIDGGHSYGFTVKKYESEKQATGDSWRHKRITLVPLSFDASFKNIEINSSDSHQLEVLGEFLDILT
jgi:uncharacterized protein